MLLSRVDEENDTNLELAMLKNVRELMQQARLKKEIESLKKAIEVAQKHDHHMSGVAGLWGGN